MTIPYIDLQRVALEARVELPKRVLAPIHLVTLPTKDLYWFVVEERTSAYRLGGLLYSVSAMVVYPHGLGALYTTEYITTGRAKEDLDLAVRICQRKVVQSTSLSLWELGIR